MRRRGYEVVFAESILHHDPSKIGSNTHVANTRYLTIFPFKVTSVRTQAYALPCTPTSCSRTKLSSDLREGESGQIFCRRGLVDRERSTNLFCANTKIRKKRISRCKRAVNEPDARESLYGRLPGTFHFTWTDLVFRGCMCWGVKRERIKGRDRLASCLRVIEQPGARKIFTLLFGTVLPYCDL